MALINTIKAAVRIRDSVPATAAEKARTADIQGYIEACMDDLMRAGVSGIAVDESDPRIIQACKLYVMAMIDYQGKGAAYMERYERFRTGIVLDPDYREASDV